MKRKLFYNKHKKLVTMPNLFNVIDVIDVSRGAEHVLEY